LHRDQEGKAKDVIQNDAYGASGRLFDLLGGYGAGIEHE